MSTEKEKQQASEIDESPIIEEESSEVLDDLNYEMEDDIIEESGLQNKLKKIRTELKNEKKQSQEYLTGWQKERASFANYKAEEDKKRLERINQMKLNLVADLFPVLDSFDMAFANRESWESVEPAWRTGVEYIHTQFMNILSQYNLEKIDQVDVPFDPLIHEPSDMVPTDDKSLSDTVATVVQSGYKSGDIVMRPAKVKVYQYEN